MSRGEEYVTVTATVKARTEKAVLLDVGDDVSRGAWVPRSTLHFMSDRTVENCAIEDEVELRVMAWVAEDKGLL